MRKFSFSYHNVNASEAAARRKSFSAIAKRDQASMLENGHEDALEHGSEKKASGGIKELPVEDESQENNVYNALTLMRRVVIPPIRTEHDYSRRKMYGSVSTIPLTKISDIEKSAHASLHARRLKENKLTPAQVEMLAKFDKGPRKIHVDLISKIVREEDEAMRREKKSKLVKRLRQAWGQNNDGPETSKPGGNIPIGDIIGLNQVQEEDDMQSMSTSLSFSTANVSSIHDDNFDVEVSNVEMDEKKNTEKKGKKPLKRSRTQVIRKRDQRLKELEEEKKAKIQSKKAKRVVKKEKTEQEVKQQMWLHLIVHFSRAEKLLRHLQHCRAERMQIQMITMRRRAKRKILAWYREYRMRRKMRQNAFFLSKLRVRLAMVLRKRRVKMRQEAAAILLHFIYSVNDSSIRTQKLYRFRNRVIKIQTVFGQFYKCQRARLKLLHLALQRELHLARLERVREQSNRERHAVKLMKRTHFFGDAVNKLDDICSNLTAMVARRTKENNLKIRKFRQLQVLNEKKEEVKQSHHILGKKNDEEWCDGRHYTHILKRVLGNQRKRHILRQKEAERVETRITTHQAVDPEEVREFLQTEGHTGPKYDVLDYKEVEKQHLMRNPLILLTGGGLRELRDIAREIVANEGEDKVNYEIQKWLMKDFGPEYDN